MRKDNYLLIGKFGKTYGTRGLVTIISFSEPKDNIFNYKTLFIKKNGNYKILQIKTIDKMGDKIVATLDNCFTPEEACIYTNTEIYIDKNELNKLSEDEHYWADLENMLVVTANNIELGFVNYLFTVGNNDVMVVNGERKYLIPFIKSIIVKVDYKTNQIIVNWDVDF